MLTIINCGIGNIGSIKNMLKKIGVEAILSSNEDDIKKADKLILSGVGSFDSAMKHLKERKIIDVIREKVMNQKIPLLGICLGMQLCTKKSKEGELSGLGFIDAETVKFNFEDKNHALKIPHMGWNSINIKKESIFFKEMYEDSRFYFMHSYCVVCNSLSDILTTTTYGYEFISSFEKNNIIGVQFHPEKSHKFGMKLFKNFVENY